LDCNAVSSCSDIVCATGGDLCTLNCIGESTCAMIADLEPTPLVVNCLGADSCYGLIDCFDACACDVFCADDACTCGQDDILCPSGCEADPIGCTSEIEGCDTC
jgi:hypothetical protein